MYGPHLVLGSTHDRDHVQDCSSDLSLGWDNCCTCWYSHGRVDIGHCSVLARVYGAALVRAVAHAAVCVDHVFGLDPSVVLR